MHQNTAILIVDDETSFVNSVVRKLRLEGYSDLTPITNPLEVVDLLKIKTFDLAFLDITMPGMDGLTLLKSIKEHSPRTECIMITANEDIPSVITAVKLGAYDYLVKPIAPDHLLHALNRALERKRMFDVLFIRREKAISDLFHNPDAFKEIITASDPMLRLLHEAELHARSEIVALITGETGVGKEVMAQAIHKASYRSQGPFVAINMLSLSTSLFESEFFGHIKGAFTGATADKDGYLAQAQGGTLFLDEIGDLPMEIQGKLLRILQEGEYTKVGKTRTEKADVRFVAATNQDLDQRVKEGKFRKDLFYRLQFAALQIPPLRDRRDDIPLLTAHFIKATSRPRTALSEAAEALLFTHDWPGNVRELKGVIEAAVNLAEKGVIEPEHLNVRPSASTGDEAILKSADRPRIEPLAIIEKRHILSVYNLLGNNKTRTARELGIGIATLQRKLKSYQVK